MEIVPATLQHMQELADNLRPADLREMRSLQPGALPRPRLALALGLSSSAYTAVHNDRVVCAGGVAPRGDGSGSVWLMGTPLMDRHRIALGRITERCVDLMHRDYRIIHNVVDPRNALHIAWLKWAGFRQFPDREVAADGTPFIPFYRINRHV